MAEMWDGFYLIEESFLNKLKAYLAVFEQGGVIILN